MADQNTEHPMSSENSPPEDSTPMQTPMSALALAQIESLAEGGIGGHLPLMDDGLVPLITTAELGALLQHAATPATDGLAMDYDGHVALALDPGTLTDLDAVLDGLTSSHLLFDVPAIDAGFAGDSGISAGDGAV